jgi:NADPH-dependent F420 reductase
MKIGILGGTGPAGRGLAARLASIDHEVVVGSRSAERAQEIVDTLLERWPALADRIEAGDNAAAAGAEVVVVATPWDAAWTTALSVSDHLEGKVVICMANALARVGHEFEALIPPRGSVAASVQAAVPACKVAASLHHVPAKELGEIEHPVEMDVLVCADHPDAKALCMELVAQIPGMRPLDAGELSQASAIEALTAVILQLNVRYKTRAAVKFTGIDADPVA